MWNNKELGGGTNYMQIRPCANYDRDVRRRKAQTLSKTARKIPAFREEFYVGDEDELSPENTVSTRKQAP